MLTAVTQFDSPAHFPHWINYYRSLGVERFLVIADSEASECELAVLAGVNRLHPESIQVLRSATPTLEGGCVLERLKTEASLREAVLGLGWIIPAEPDEFVRFPCDLPALLSAMEQSGATSLLGHVFDRLAVNGSLDDPKPDPSIWQQYPLRCELRSVLQDTTAPMAHPVLIQGSSIDQERLGPPHPALGTPEVHRFWCNSRLLRTLASPLSSSRFYDQELRQRHLLSQHLRKYRRLIPEHFGAVPGWSPASAACKPFRANFRRYIGLNVGAHDGGIACIDEEGQLEVFCQSERLTRKKSDGQIGKLGSVLETLSLRPTDASDAIFTTWRKCFKHYLKTERLFPSNVRADRGLPGYDPEQGVHYLSHHLCHAVASWMFRDCEDPGPCLYIALDGAGYRSDGGVGCYSVGEISATRLTEFAFGLSSSRFSPHQRLNHIALPHTSMLHVAGKLMGIAGYVGSSAGSVTDPPSIAEINAKIGAIGLTPEVLRDIARIYNQYIADVKQRLRFLLGQYPQYKNVVVGGGAFLALELNSFIVESGRNLIFAPCVNDSGIALGSAAIGFFHANGRWPRRIESPFVQWCPPERRNRYLPPAAAASVLAQNQVLGTVIGNAEVGPRALGNRSLLALPTAANAERVSCQIKGREFYRPVAPVVTARAFGELFTGPAGRFMQFRNEAKDAARELAPGIVHRDGSSRVQVVDPDSHPWLHETLVHLGTLTGCECLINTSLNGRGLPICNTLADFDKELGGLGIAVAGF